MTARQRGPTIISRGLSFFYKLQGGVRSSFKDVWVDAAIGRRYVAGPAMRIFQAFHERRQLEGRPIRDVAIEESATPESGGRIPRDTESRTA